MFSTWPQAEESFDELLDSEGDVTLLGVPYTRSRLLKETDPIAYRGGLLDYIDSCGVDSDDLE